MKRIVDVKKMRAMEARTIDEIGVPSLCLMERAAFAVADIIDKNKTVTVFCGIGNNGADGLAVARMLFTKGTSVNVVLIGEETKQSKEGIIQKNICRNLGIEFVKDYSDNSSDLYVDALFGIGLTRNVEGEYLKAIQFMNERKIKGASIISVDIPSGLNSDSGKVLGLAVRADITVTFEWLKQGLILGDGPVYSGELKVASVGILSDNVINEAAFGYTKEDLCFLPNRNILGNKGTFGKVLCITGSEDMAGAAILSARAAFKSGCGMVKIISHSVNRSIVINELPEAMFDAYDDITDEELMAAYDWCDVCLVGPGLSTSDAARRITIHAVNNCQKTLVLDADGLNIISSDMSLLKNRADNGYQSILTPHPGEFARLFNQDIKSKLNQDVEFVRSASLGYSFVLVAKDARTVISDGNKIYINLTSSSALATAGSGDVLAGIIASFACIFPNIFDAACYGTLVHSFAGMDAAKLLGERAVLASDVVNGISKVLKS